MQIKVVQDNRAEVLAELDSKEQAVLEAIGKRARTYAKANAPVDTGRLRASITYRINGDTVAITTDVEYAKYQEFGTIYIRGKHFMRNAMTNHIGEYIQIARSILEA